MLQKRIEQLKRDALGVRMQIDRPAQVSDCPMFYAVLPCHGLPRCCAPHDERKLVFDNSDIVPNIERSVLFLVSVSHHVNPVGWKTSLQRALIKKGGVMERDYDDVPGTYVFDGRRYRMGYHLNMFLMSLNKAACRDEFANDERAYLAKFPMTDAQRDAVLNREWLKMLHLGGNVYYAFKLISHDRKPPQVMYGQMANPNMTFDEFQAMMLDGGRPIEGNRSKKEQSNG